MTEVHPMASKELTPIEVATQGFNTSQQNVNTIFTVELKENQNLPGTSTNNPKEFNEISPHVSRVNMPNPNNKSDVNSDIGITAQRTASDPSLHSASNSDATNEISENYEPSLEDEKLKHEKKASDRKEKFTGIVMGEQVELEWKKFVVNILIAILPSVATIMPIALIPMQNLLLNPEYWYETWIYLIPLFNWCGLSTSFIAAYSLNLTLPLRTRNIMLMQVTLTTFVVILVITTYWIWTQALGHQYPVPITGYLFTPPLLTVLLLTTWMNFPSVWRQTRKLRARMLYFMLLFIYPTFIFKIQLDIVSRILKQNQVEYQLSIPLLLPFIRELNLWILTKLTQKVANGDLPGANIIARFSLSAWYTIALCFILGSSATNTTTWVLVVTDFAINTILSTQIVWKKIKSPDKIGHLIDMIQELAVYELVEFLAPSAFLLSFALLVYGPNCDLIGNLCNDYWQFEAIQDFSQAFQNMGTFFLVDLFSTLVTATILKVFCQINIWHVMMELLKEFNYAFCAILGTRLFNVSKIMNWSQFNL